VLITLSGLKLRHLLALVYQADFPLGRRELNVSTYQMCILMLFNEKTSLTLEEIKTAADIPDIELRRHLLSLCTPRVRILKKSSKSKVQTLQSTV
jgi:cullin 3